MLKTSEVETLETAQQLLHFKDEFNYQTIKQLSAVLFLMHTKPVPIKLHIATASGICHNYKMLCNIVSFQSIRFLIFKIAHQVLHSCCISISIFQRLYG